MKTTIELPNSIVKKAKMIAADRRTTLRALVVLGLEHVITEKHVTSNDRAKKLFAAIDRGWKSHWECPRSSALPWE